MIKLKHKHEGMTFTKLAIEDCLNGDPVSLCESNDKPLNVRIEIRAAEIIASGRFVKCLETQEMEWNCEQCGWDDYNANDHVQPLRHWLAGYLARCIHDHPEITPKVER